LIYLFEDFSYQANFLDRVVTINGVDLKKSIPNSFIQRVSDVKSQVKGVGYFFNPCYKASDDASGVSETIFVFPKVFLNYEYDTEGNVVGASAFGSKVKDCEFFGMENVPKKFLAELSLWVSSSIARYRQDRKNVKDVSVSAPDAYGFKKNIIASTLLDVKNAMERFYEENKTLFAFVSKNKHSGNNKINWQKTICKKTPFLQEGSPVYTDFVNKKKVFDLDDRLLVLYFSAMNYIQKTFNLVMPKSDYYVPMPVNEFRNLLGVKGVMELRRIKHKYFSDKFLKLYNIVLAFFEWGASFKANGYNSEYMLITRYNNVFEHMINTLVGETDLPKDIQFLKNQRDGKDIDHLYKDQSLVLADGRNPIWFVGDSKYYSEGKRLKRGDIAKQFTYAKNIVQYNTYDCFNPSFNKTSESLRYRERLTEGYSVTPNFFIRGFLPKAEIEDGNVLNVMDSYFRLFDEKNPPERYKDNKEAVDNNRLFAKDDSRGYTVVDEDGEKLKNLDVDDALWRLRNYHFENRLFDRDTLLLQVYNVNFLYTVKTFLSRNSNCKDEYRDKARRMFRDDFLTLLETKYVFWILRPKKDWTGCDAVFVDMVALYKDFDSITDATPSLKAFVLKHGRTLAGKMFKPQEFETCILVALEMDFALSDEAESFWASFEKDCEMIAPVSPRDVYEDAVVVKKHESLKYDPIRNIDSMRVDRDNDLCLPLEKLNEL